MIIYKKATKKDIPDFLFFFRKSINEDFPYYSKKAKNYIKNKTYTEQQITNAMERGGVLFLAQDGKKIVGYFLAKASPAAGVWNGGWIAVHRDYRGRNIGTRLLNEWEKEALQKGVHCLRLQTDKKNLQFYKKAGFGYIGSIPKGTYGQEKHLFFKIIQEPDENKFLS